MKYIITHLSPDLDAIVGCWLIKKYYPGFKNASIYFVPAGTTYKNQSVDTNKNIIHVDTGLGRFDHHQSDEYTCASEKIFKYLNQKKFIKKSNSQALKKFIKLVTAIDHFQEINFFDPTNDIYETMIHQIIEGLKKMFVNDNKVVETIFPIIDAILINFKTKIQAEKEISQGFIFESPWGKSLALLSKNEEALKIALKKNFQLVIRQDPEKKYLRIKIRPDHKKNLVAIYKKLKEIDSKATWFLHSSKKMLLNGSSKNPKVVPTHMSIKRIIEIIKNI